MWSFVCKNSYWSLCIPVLKMSGEGYKMQSLQGRQVSALFLRRLTSWDHRTCSFKPDQECYEGDIMCANAEHGELQAKSVILRSFQRCLRRKLPAFMGTFSLWESWDMAGCHWEEEQVLCVPHGSGSTFFIISEWVCDVSRSHTECLVRWFFFKTKFVKSLFCFSLCTLIWCAFAKLSVYAMVRAR